MKERSAVNSILKKLRKGWKHWRNYGFRSLLSLVMRLSLSHLLLRHSISTKDLRQMGEKENQIWYEKKEEPPVYLPEPDHPILRREFEEYPKKHCPRSPFVCELSHCNLIGKNGAAFYGGMNLILETIGHRPWSFTKGAYREIFFYMLRDRLGYGPQKNEDRVFPLVCPDPSYYHWILEYVPKLRLLELYESETGKMAKILISSQPSDFVLETLEMAGFSRDRILQLEASSTGVNELVVATHRPHFFDYDNLADSQYSPSPRDIKWLSRRMKSQVSESLKSKFGNRIFISRQKSKRGRKVLNYDPLLEKLDQYGIIPYVLEDYSFEEQVALFSGAELIIGAHGAGLVNMIFSQNPVVIELFPDSVIKPHFYFLSKILGFQYEPLIETSRESNLSVDIDQLTSTIERVCPT